MKSDVLGTPIFYHPLAGTRGGFGAPKWSVPIWNLLWESGVRTIQDVWDPESNVVTAPAGFTGVQAGRARATVQRFLDGLPIEYTEALQRVRVVGEVLHLPLYPGGVVIAAVRCRGAPKRDEEELDPNPFQTGFKTMYQAYLQRRLRGTDFSHKTVGIIEAYNRLVPRQKTPLVAERLWRGARVLYGVPKTGDLIWRLLHGEVRTGTKLDWIPVEQQYCQPDQSDLTCPHIWIECSVAKAVWTEVKLIWQRIALKISTPPFFEFTTLKELIGLLAIGPPLRGVDKRRWMTLCQVAFWCLWKCYLSHSFGETANYWQAESARGYFVEAIKKHIFTDRAAALSEAYNSKQCPPDTFAALWGEKADEIRVSKGPFCLQLITLDPESELVPWFQGIHLN